MLSITGNHKVYLAIEAIDFRNGLDGIIALCKNVLALDPFSGHYFIFRNRKASSIKILVYDSQGFWLCQKRLSRGYFRHWPTIKTQVATMTSTQLQVLLQNGDPASIECEPPWRPID
ncbi:MAG: IS66 family insertion sequence element accessory protein TnpB [Gammaproteobacteria bacterium]|nr:IS66 family insertion sequence element accessory protein TnpB [Gammaproteobacteria bacterium]